MTYIYRQDRIWTVSRGGGQDCESDAEVQAEAGTFGHGVTGSDDARLRRGSRDSSSRASNDPRGEIVAVLRAMFEGLDTQYLIPFSLLKMGRLVVSRSASGRGLCDRESEFEIPK